VGEKKGKKEAEECLLIAGARGGGILRHMLKLYHSFYSLRGMLVLSGQMACLTQGGGEGKGSYVHRFSAVEEKGARGRGEGF